MVVIENPPANAGGEGDPWCGKIPHATRQLTCAPQLLSPRSAARAATARHNQRPSAAAPPRNCQAGPGVTAAWETCCKDRNTEWVCKLRIRLGLRPREGWCREGPAAGETPAGLGAELGRKFVPEERLRGSEPGWGAADAGVRGKVGDGGHVPVEKGPPHPTPGKPTQEGLQVPAGLPVRFGRRS